MQLVPYAVLAVVSLIILAGAVAHFDTQVELLVAIFVVLAALTAPHMILVDLKPTRPSAELID